MYIKFLDSKTPIECLVKQIAPNIVELRFADEIVENTSGFRAYLDKKCEYDIGGNSYIDFTTIYRNDETTLANNGYQLSNDGSEYVEPIPVVNFGTNGGGVLDGVVMQEVNTYEELIIPTPIPNENYEFSYWSPEIPLSGDIEGNKTFTAIFTSTSPEPEPQPEPSEDLETRVTALETDVQAINNALGGALNE